MKTTTTFDGHVHKNEALQHLSSALLLAADKKVEQTDTTNPVLNYILQTDLQGQVEMIRKLAMEVMVNPSKVYDSLVATAEELEENLKHV